MITLKNLKIYEGYDGELKDAGAIFLISDDGKDWYDTQSDFQQNTLKLLLSENDVVLAHTYDVTTIWPINMTVVEIDHHDSLDGLVGMVYNHLDKTFSERPERDDNHKVKFNKLSERKKVLDMKKEFDIISPAEVKEHTKIIEALKKLLSDM